MQEFTYYYSFYIQIAGILLQIYLMSKNTYMYRKYRVV